jgi:hypothetical protein
MCYLKEGEIHMVVSHLLLNLLFRSLSFEYNDRHAPLNSHYQDERQDWSPINCHLTSVCIEVLQGPRPNKEISMEALATIKGAKRPCESNILLRSTSKKHSDADSSQV